MLRGAYHSPARLTKTAARETGNVLSRATHLVMEMLEGRRLLSAGTLDPTFGTGGIVTDDPSSGGSDLAYDVAVQSNDKIVVGGGAGAPSALSRYTTDR